MSHFNDKKFTERITLFQFFSNTRIKQFCTNIIEWWCFLRGILFIPTAGVYQLASSQVHSQLVTFSNVTLQQSNCFLRDAVLVSCNYYYYHASCNSFSVLIELLCRGLPLKIYLTYNVLCERVLSSTSSSRHLCCVNVIKSVLNLFKIQHFGDQWGPLPLILKE